MWWPSPTDPFWLANQSENQARQQYYNVSGTPTMKCDGSTASWPSIQSIIQSRMTVASPLWMDLSATVNNNNLNVTCTAIANTNISGNYALHLVLLDRYSYIPTSPNGQPHHYHAMLDMAPSASGQAFTATANDTVHYYGTFVLNPSWAIENLDISTFVQNNSNQEVLQSHCEQVPVNFPGLYYIDYTLQDNGNNDGRAEPGETAYLYVTLGNGEPFQPATNVVGTLSTDDPDLTIITPTVNFPNIPNGQTGTNTNPFVFYVDLEAEPHITTFQLEVVADPLQTTMTADIEMWIGWPEVMLVDDDGNWTFETYYQSTLENLGISYENWNTLAQGPPTIEEAGGYPIIMWLTAYISTNVLSTEEQTFIQDYLNNGGNLFISGQNIAQGLNTSSPTFLHDVLHANLTSVNTNVKILDGVAGNPVGDGLLVNCNSGGSGSGSCNSPDGVSVIAPASEAFTYQGLTHKGGLTYEGTSGEKLVYFAFPFEAISGQSGSNTREQVMQAILDFFAPEAPPVTITLEPVNPPIIIPASGGSFNYNITITNAGTSPQNFDGWCDVTLPNGNNYGPVLGPINLTLSTGASVTRLRTQSVPANAPSGDYTYNGYVGDYPGTVWNSDSFPFVKLAAGDGVVVTDWINLGESFARWSSGSLPAPAEVPEDFALTGVYPNPFNPSTTLSFALPRDAYVKLQIYSVTGSLVQTLVNGWREAGNHEAVFDASTLTSGVYIYRLQADDFTASGKMVLMK